MKIRYQINLFCLVLLIASCKNKEVKLSQEELTRQSIVHQNIEWLDSANVVEDALRAIKEDSICFIGVYGYALTVPGVNDYYKHYDHKIPIKPIYGTTDFIRTEEDHRINYLAREYALQFNAIILAHMKSSSLPANQALKLTE